MECIGSLIVFGLFLFLSFWVVSALLKQLKRLIKMILWVMLFVVALCIGGCNLGQWVLMFWIASKICSKAYQTGNRIKETAQKKYRSQTFGK